MEELRNSREENDFLAVASTLGLVTEDDVTKGREAERKREKPEYDPSNSKFGSWMGGLTVGTPMSNEQEFDEDDVLVRLARRVEERRVELGLESVDEKLDDGEKLVPGTTAETSGDGPNSTTNKTPKEPEKEGAKCNNLNVIVCFWSNGGHLVMLIAGCKTGETKGLRLAGVE
eukprot:CAMPEP_0171622608 /NCGR_PEP_ID=MMETSP0990-20121206/17364_1 /TAXON_ID=483369 /ORGANISM="non described non described, Strain CCMP2098" /LENGTH=172 /DNA_ID=CAMNT_0012188477 /DNA_START=213 /DNA_END=732 /DNA_ORIENTATION=+